MNKKLKVATAAVSVVMAGTLALGISGCVTTPKDKNTSAEKIVAAVNSKLNYGTYSALCNTAYTRLTTGVWAAGEERQQKKTIGTLTSTDTVTLNFNVGDKDFRSIAYAAGMVTGTVTLPDGSEASTGKLKPVWQDLQSIISEQTGGEVIFADVFKNESGKIDKAETTDKESKPLSSYDLITDGQTNIAKYQADLLDLSLYLDDMPNYKAFLNANSTVKESLTFNGGAMYYAPYFDGYDDVEKYSLFKLNWVESLLDASAGDATQTWAASMKAKGKTADKASIESYMGKTGSWNTDVLDKDGAKVTGGITVNYDKALAAAKGTTGLGAAVTEAAGKAYDGESGNIVDIMNYVINEKAGEVTGAQLLKIMQEYIKVAYYVGTSETAFYAQTDYKVSDVFNGYSAAWDVDLFAALGRVMITNPTLLKSGSKGNTIGGTDATALADTYLVSARETGMQRHADIVSWVGELYGVRGLESRYAYAYIDAEGKWHDTRGETAGYEAMNAFSAFYKEGLVYSGEMYGKDASQSYYYASSAGNVEAMALHDYLNTQTPAGFKLTGDTTAAKYNIEEGYNYTANLTAISKWDVNGNGAIGNDEYFRFTESWRSVKDSGIAVPLTTANDAKKLKAVLTFIDYIFSDDGQIVMAYGLPASDETGTGGFWYNPEYDSSVHTEADGWKTFTFQGKTYASKTIYGGKGVPTLTTNVKNAYVGQEVNGFKFGGGTDTGTSSADNKKWTKGSTLSYTDFARNVMGSALNFGNKLTSLEFQMTSEMGKAGAQKVDTAVTEGIIRHTTPSLAAYSTKYGIGDAVKKWYTIAPSSLPFTTAETAKGSDMVNNCSDLYQKGEADTIFTIHKTTTTNLYLEIIMKGYDASKYNNAFNKLRLK